MVQGASPEEKNWGVIEHLAETKIEEAARKYFRDFPEWLAGPPVNGDFSTVPGDGVDGYARERVVRPATWFTHAPRGWSAAESATLPTGVTAWPLSAMAH